MVLGPLDRRVVKTRCQACAKRRIKCTGPPPCSYCKKKKIKCFPQANEPSTNVVFVNTRARPDLEANEVSRGVRPTGTDAALTQFFTVFITRNDFSGGDLDMNAIISSFQHSSSLYHAALAIGALDLRSISSSLSDRRAVTAMALASYQISITSFSSEIQSSDIGKSDAALWTTLFLGLFELMYDVTGEGWVKHILYGTSSILQFRGPEAHLHGRGRSFFLTIRPFEICRSLIYSEPSFLSQPDWIAVTERLWCRGTESHPKEELFDLMLSCSSLSCRVWEVIKLDIATYDDLLLRQLSTEGHQLRASLHDWYERFQERNDSWSILAATYYYAISIYLSGIFDYRPQFDHISSPSLSHKTIQTHVTNILTNLELGLRTNLAGILFFFPLRVAGARAWSTEQKASILGMLKEISSRAFVVADAFVLDLNTLWLTKRKREEARKACD